MATDSYRVLSNSRRDYSSKPLLRGHNKPFKISLEAHDPYRFRRIGLEPTNIPEQSNRIKEELLGPDIGLIVNPVLLQVFSWSPPATSRAAAIAGVVPEQVRDIAFLMIPDLLVSAIGHR